MSGQGFQPNRDDLMAIYDGLMAAYGAQGWWPGDTPFEIMVGAVLTQNTAWTNVEKAIANLKSAGVLSPDAILALADDRLAELIRPSGYYNIKARRLKNFCRFLTDAGGASELAGSPTDELRGALLEVNGIGPETADDILLYAFDRPVFVIDAYTRRLLQRCGLAAGTESYEALRRGFEKALGPDVSLYKEYHALVVQHAKATCTSTPRCSACGLPPVCPVAG
jgi:endonuclease-3 related protein